MARKYTKIKKETLEQLLALLWASIARIRELEQQDSDSDSDLAKTLTELEQVRILLEGQRDSRQLLNVLAIATLGATIIAPIASHEYANLRVGDDNAPVPVLCQFTATVVAVSDEHGYPVSSPARSFSQRVSKYYGSSVTEPMRDEIATFETAQLAARDLVPFAARVRDLVDAHGGSKASIARAAGISSDTLNEVLRGRRQMKAATMGGLARAFGVSVDGLTEGTDAWRAESHGR